MNNSNSNRREPFIGAPESPDTSDHGLGDILGQNATRGTSGSRPPPAPPGVNPYAGQNIPGSRPVASSDVGRDAPGDTNQSGPGELPDAAAPAGQSPAPAGRMFEAGAMGSNPVDLPDFDGEAPIYADEQAALARLIAEVEQLRTEVAEARERQIRAAAEAENARRRASEDVAKAYKFSVESFAEAMLPVVDSLEMALKVESPTVEALREGSEATLRQIMTAFEKNKLVAINPAGEKFDPNRHQAISMVPANAVHPPVPANHIAAVLQKGYLINERVLRPALVTVVQG